MPRRLILMRHAKSDWSTGEADHARPLNARGRRDAPRIASALADAGWVPDLVLCSDAMRTTETWERMSGAFGGSPRLVRTRALYLAGIGDLQVAIGEHAGHSVHTVLALGHNPGWENAASLYAQEPLRMTTANAALLEFDEVPWMEAVTSPARQFYGVLRPKELPEE